MQPSIHYYVLSLSEDKSGLYEGFRDKLIDIQDGIFPLEISPVGNPVSKDTRLRDFFHRTDLSFAHYYEQDPLRLVLVGEKSSLAIFTALKTRQDVLIGKVEGDYSATSTHDLGKIVWPVVKEAIAGVNKNAMRDLAIAAGRHKVVFGIEEVGKCAESEAGATLYVEEDYHVKGSLLKTDHKRVFSKLVNIWQVLDDVVDVIIEKVLKTDGNVIFVNSGSLIKLDRIALILSG
ncbi:MAG: hypothetical protein EHM72_06500 [Calditrichaeota bacterium]|nr:MAG: hypothetical protein EHM72_06500 [Calditrichota bacterium]